MGFFEFVVAIVSMVFVFVLLLNFVRGQRGRVGQSQEASLQREVAALRDRVEALEAIVTDRPRQLAQEIDSLERGVGREARTA